MGPLLAVLYIVMAVWLLIAGARRIAMELAAGVTPLDWTPFVSGGIGLLALLLALPAHDLWLNRRRDR